MKSDSAPLVTVQIGRRAPASLPCSTGGFTNCVSPPLGARRAALLCWRLSGCGLAANPFRQFPAASFAIPLFKCLVGDLSFNEKLSELASLRLALEGHTR